MPSTDVPSGRVVIAIDPHKTSWTAAAVDTTLTPLDTLRAPVSGRVTASCAGSPRAGRVRAGRSERADGDERGRAQQDIAEAADARVVFVSGGVPPLEGADELGP